MPWLRAKLRGTPVYVRTNDTGELLETGGRVEIRYKPNDGRRYRANPGNLVITDRTLLPDDTCSEAHDPEPKPQAEAQADQPAKAAWEAWTDGACTGNPGPAGLGVVLLRDDEQVEVSEYLGKATNNIAELTAILRALEMVPQDQPLLIRTDSQYSIGVLQKGWKPKVNQELIERIKSELRARRHTRLQYTPGHAGVALNEKADMLARGAITARGNRTLTRPRRRAGEPKPQ